MVKHSLHGVGMGLAENPALNSLCQPEYNWHSLSIYSVGLLLVDVTSSILSFAFKDSRIKHESEPILGTVIGLR
jgi:hypothetical protein